MPSKEDLKRRAAEIIDSKADELTALAQTILKNPEPGFRELKTARLVAEKFAELGMQPRNGLAVTGVRADALGGSAGPTLAILGEMDSLIVAEHPHAEELHAKHNREHAEHQQRISRHVDLAKQLHPNGCKPGNTADESTRQTGHTKQFHGADQIADQIIDRN